MTSQPLSSAGSAELLAAARDIAVRAGALLLERLGHAGRVEAKAGTEFVTEADRAAEDFILGELSRRFPGDHVLAEESGDSGAPEHGGTAPGTSIPWTAPPTSPTATPSSASIGCADDAACWPARCSPRTWTRSTWPGRRRRRAGTAAPRQPTACAAARTGRTAAGAAGHGLSLRAGRHGGPQHAAGAGFPEGPCHGVRRGGSAALDLCHTAAGKLDGTGSSVCAPGTRRPAP